MRLVHGLHLAYCTNIHRGESWAETMDALETHVLRVRQRVCPPDEPYAIGLRLSARAAADLEGTTLTAFRRWLDAHNCYVFTINGFPYGDFHGTRVKEQVYAPDWSQPERRAYTMQLFRLLAQLLPDGVGGSVSTVPGSFKDFITGPDHVSAIIRELRCCADEIESLAEASGRDLHLGLEPEPLCLIETTPESVDFFGQLRDGLDSAALERFNRRIGINYDTCHLAVEFEDAADALERLHDAQMRLSKLHLSSALVLPDPAANRHLLASYVEDTYLHQVVEARQGQVLRRFTDLDQALTDDGPRGDEWRVHFHVPLHADPVAPVRSTSDQLVGALSWLAKHPQACQHLEMETYTWGVLPEELRSGDVVNQLAREYHWTLDHLTRLGLPLESS